MHHTRTTARSPLPWAIEDVYGFLVRNTRHLTRVVGLTRVAVDEYPHEALREALVNAAAHRDYGLAGVCVRVEKFASRIVIRSPGGPPNPVTMRRIRALTYTPCSRNPNLARTLSYFERIEEQGDGIRRIVTDVRNHGLPEVRFGMDHGLCCGTRPSPRSWFGGRPACACGPADQCRSGRRDLRCPHLGRRHLERVGAVMPVAAPCRELPHRRCRSPARAR